MTSDDDDAERDGEILPDDRAGAAAQFVGGEEIFQPVVHEDDVGLLERGVAARARPWPRRRARRRGSGASFTPSPIMAASSPRFREALDDRELLLGLQLGAHVVEAEFGFEKIGGALLVAGEDDGAQAAARGAAR